MRLFVAIDIDRAAMDRLCELQSRIGSAASAAGVGTLDLRWVRPESVHLTLKFIGQAHEKTLRSLCGAVEEVAARHSAFELDLESVRCFGGRWARVLWVGTGAGSDRLGMLAADLDGRLASAGWPPETRSFHGHLTLCRINRAGAGLTMQKLIGDFANYKAGTIEVDEVCVYSSDLKPTGAQYCLMAAYRLS